MLNTDIHNTDSNEVDSLDVATATRRKFNYIPHLVLILVQIMFGSFAVVGKIALAELPSTGLVALRVGGAAIALWILRSILKQDEAQEKITKADWLMLAVCSLLGVVLNQFLFIKGLSLSTAINATLLGCAIPIWTLIMSFLLRREQSSMRKIVGCVVAIAGVLYLVNPMQAHFDNATVFGDSLLILNTACYGAYLAISQNIIKRLGALRVITWLFTLAALVCVPVGIHALADVSLAEIHLKTWRAVIYIILAPSVAAYYLNAWALARVEPSTVAAYIYLQPLSTLR